MRVTLFFTLGALLLSSCNVLVTPDSDVEAEIGSLAAATELHVTPSGSGSVCSTLAPCSLVGARDKARTLNSNMQGDIIVSLADGTYSLSSPFTLRETSTTHDSGTNGHNVIYQAAPGARPILSGGARITGWTLWDQARNIYRANVGTEMQTRQLYVNGVRATRARGQINPIDYQPVRATGFTGPDGTLASWKNPSQVEIVGRALWKSFRCPVASITNQSWRNVVAASSGQGFSYGDWFRPDLLTNAGEGTRYHTGDFDGNRKTDLLFAYEDGNGRWRNEVATSDGSAFSFTAPADWLPGAGKGTTYHVGDFNDDDRSDLLFAYEDGGGQWRNEVALSNGRKFVFAAPANWLPGAGKGTTYHIGDFNRDGADDLLLSYYDAAQVWHNDVALSDRSSFHFAGNWLPNAGQNTTYHVGDFNGDDADDLLFSYYDNANIWRNHVALSDGSSFHFAGDWLPNAGQNTTYHVGDYNGDGSDDLLFSYYDNANLWRNDVALSNGSSFQFAGNWLPSAGQGAVYHVGNFVGSPSDRTTDLLFAGHDASIAMQEPCWTDAHSHVDSANMNTVTWIENALELLDSPGEWYLDRSEGIVYYRPRNGEDLAVMPVVAATLETLIDGQGEVSETGTRFLHNVQFKGLTFAYATWLAPSSSSGYPEVQAGWHGNIAAHRINPDRTPGSVTFSAARSLRFERNIFTHLGAVGLNLDSGSQDNVVVGNVFRDVSSTAIQIGDVSEANRTTMDPDKQARNNTLANNYITDVAVEYESAVGIFVGYSDGATITHNEVAGLPYSGISVGWGWGQQPDHHPTGCDHSYARNNTIAGNFIHDVMLALHDGGGIYTLSGQLDSLIDSNHISDLGHGIGLYHDEGTCYYEDRNNVIAGVERPADMWMSMNGANGDRYTVINNHVHHNFANDDYAGCPHGGRTSDTCDDGVGNVNLIEENYFTDGIWPSAALSIMGQAGLEPAYLGIKSPVCGDATCNGGETAASCSKDCL